MIYGTVNCHQRITWGYRTIGSEPDRNSLIDDGADLVKGASPFLRPNPKSKLYVHND